MALRARLRASGQDELNAFNGVEEPLVGSWFMIRCAPAPSGGDATAVAADSDSPVRLLSQVDCRPVIRRSGGHRSNPYAE